MQAVQKFQGKDLLYFYRFLLKLLLTLLLLSLLFPPFPKLFWDWSPTFSAQMKHGFGLGFMPPQAGFDSPKNYGCWKCKGGPRGSDPTQLDLENSGMVLEWCWNDPSFQGLISWQRTGAGAAARGTLFPWKGRQQNSSAKSIVRGTGMTPGPARLQSSHCYSRARDQPALK